MSRLKSRRATTGFSELNEKKSIKTYGSKASQDDSQIRSSVSLDIEYAPDKRIRFSGESTNFQGNDANQETIEARSGLQGFDISSSAMFLDNKIIFQGKENAGDEPKPIESAQSPMPPPSSKFVNGVQTQASGCSTMPLSLATQERGPDNAASATTSDLPNITPSTDRMPSPTLSDRSQKESAVSLDYDKGILKSRKRPRSQTESPDPINDRSTELNTNDSMHIPAKRVRIEKLVPAKECEEGDEVENTNPGLVLPASPPPPIRTKSKSTKSRTIQKRDQITPGDDPGLDEIAVGLPEEQYQPRPSRSRSGLADGELWQPIDFSKKPETTARRKKKNRRKTTAFERPLHDEDDEPNVEILIPLKTETPYKEVLDDLENVEEDDGDILSDGKQSRAVELDSTATPPQPKKRGRPKKQAIKPPSNQPPPDKHLEPSEPQPISNPPPPQLSHSKTDTYTLPSSPSSPHPTSPNQEPIPAPISSPPKTLPTTKSTTTESPSPTKAQPPPPQTPQKPNMDVKGPDKHSPLNSGKVAYRVGLSKRARIEPLLRVLRK